MSITGKILLVDNTNDIFPGDDLNLLVEIENQENIFAKEFFINFRGEINVKWDDLINKSKDGNIIYIMQEFEGQQVCVNKHLVIQTMDVIKKGTHLYNVMLNIPPQLPASISRKYGCTKYELELGVHVAGEKKILNGMPLDIKGYLNIGLKSEYMRPFHTVFKKSFCWGICNSQPLKITLTLPKTSFVAGDYIRYLVVIQNFNGFIDLQRLSAILTQTHHYKALKPKRRTKQVHTTINLKMHHFNRHHHNSKFEGSLKLPTSLVPTSQEDCLLETSYKLQFILVFKGFHTDSFITLPIVVGTHKDITEKIVESTVSEIRLAIEHEIKREYVV